MFVSSHMYPENPEGTQVIVGSMNMGYIKLLAGSAQDPAMAVQRYRALDLLVLADIENGSAIEDIWWNHTC